MASVPGPDPFLKPDKKTLYFKLPLLYNLSNLIKGDDEVFVVRGKGGLVFTNCEQGENNGKEVVYETREEAEEVREYMQSSFKGQKLYVEEIKVGRPSLGLTKKVSITLPEEDWEWIDQQGSRSETFRKLVRNARNK